MDNFSPGHLPQTILPSQRVTREYLNKVSYAIRKMNQGITAPTPIPPVGLSYPQRPANVVTVNAATTNNVESLADVATIDGIDLAEGDSVALLNQDDPTENGVYTVHAVSDDNPDGTWDGPTIPDLILVQAGNAYSGYYWLLQVNDDESTLYGNAIEETAAAALSNSSVTTSGLQTIDGISLAAGQQVLLTAQDDATENGLYVVEADTDTNGGIWEYLGQPGTVTIEQGTKHKLSIWALASPNTYQQIKTAAQWFKIVTVKKDYLECTDLVSRTSFNVAKATMLQTSGEDWSIIGQSFNMIKNDGTVAGTVSYAATGGTLVSAPTDGQAVYATLSTGGNEVDVVGPPYQADQYLLAVPLDTLINDDDENPIFFQDLNISGRAWQATS